MLINVFATLKNNNSTLIVDDSINIPQHTPPTNNVPPDNDIIMAGENVSIADVAAASNHVRFNNEPPRTIINNIPNINNIKDKCNDEFQEFYNDIIGAPADEIGVVNVKTNPIAADAYESQYNGHMYNDNQ